MCPHSDDERRTDESYGERDKIMKRESRTRAGTEEGDESAVTVCLAETDPIGQRVGRERKEGRKEAVLSVERRKIIERTERRGNAVNSRHGTCKAPELDV